MGGPLSRSGHPPRFLPLIAALPSLSLAMHRAKKFPRRLSALVLLLSLAACGGPDPDSRAEALCACLHPLDSLNARFSEALAVEDDTRAMALLESISAEATRSRACLLATGLPADAAALDEERLRPRLDLACPGWESMLASLPPR